MFVEITFSRTSRTWSLVAAGRRNVVLIMGAFTVLSTGWRKEKGISCLCPSSIPQYNSVQCYFTRVLELSGNQVISHLHQ